MSVSKELNIKKKIDKDKVELSLVLVNGKVKDIVSDDNKSFIYIVNGDYKKDEEIVIDYKITNKSNNKYFININCDTSNKYKDYYTLSNNYIDNIDKNDIDGKLILKVKEDKTIKEIIMCELSYIKK
jgi:hypothetical protein